LCGGRTGRAERSGGVICQLVRLGEGGRERLNKALSLLFGKVRNVCVRRGAAFRRRALSSSSSTISFHSFKCHLFSLICFRISSYPIFTFLLFRCFPPLGFIHFFPLTLSCIFSFFCYFFHSFLLKRFQSLKCQRTGKERMEKKRYM
jgi:hypothetical protein